MPDATMVSGRALTIAHQRPSVTTPIGTPEARSSSSIRSIGLAAQPSSSRIPQRVDGIDDEDQRPGHAPPAPARRSGSTVTA